jgi:hypothetical protein
MEIMAWNWINDLLIIDHKRLIIDVFIIDGFYEISLSKQVHITYSIRQQMLKNLTRNERAGIYLWRLRWSVLKIRNYLQEI